MKRYLIYCFVLLNTTLFAQQVQWSSKILDFSTQFDTNDFSAVKLLGPPDVPSEGGRHPNAWMAKSPDTREFISVGFDTAVNVQQIAIFESFNPGAIYKVYLYDERNILHVVGTMVPKPADKQSRVLHILMDETPYKVNALRLIIDGAGVPGYNGIDAIGISNSTELIQKRKNFAYRRNPRLRTEEVSLGAEGDISDTRPVYSDRMKRLYFTRGYSSENTGSKSDPGDVMIVIYSQANNTFSNPVYMGEEINNIGFNSTNGIVTDGDSESLIIGNVTGNPNKVEANLVQVGRDEDGNWSEAKEQKIKKSGIFNMDVDYHITRDGNALFIAAERKNSLGGRDIYVSLNTGEGKWSEPENLGNVINTSEDEYAPFFSVAENALYFASKGHGGMGGSDIFRVIRQDDTWINWSDPENIGSDINTEMDEKYFYFDDVVSTAYFARAKNDSVFGIYMVERPTFIDPNPEVTLKGRVTEEGEGSPIGAVVSLFTLPEEQMYALTFSDESTGLYNILLRSGYEYKLKGESEGYQPVEMTLSLDNRMTPYDYELDISLSRELIEAAPELQEEIAQIQEQDRDPAQERTVILPAIQEARPVSKEEPDEISTDDSTEPPAQTKVDKLTSISPEKETQPEEETQPEKETVREPLTRTGIKREVSTANLIRYNFNSAELLPESFVVLDAIVQFLQQHDFIRLEIGGFTDHIGDEMYNVELGRRRALAVKGYLTKSGIAGNRIRIIGFGEKMPIILSTDIEKLQTNRRVEFNFTR